MGTASRDRHRHASVPLIISQAVVGGGETTLCHSPLPMATPNDANRPLPSAPLVCIHVYECIHG